LEAERRAYYGNKAMLARLKAWKAKEVQERVQQKNLFFMCALPSWVESWHPAALFFFAFQLKFFIGFPIWPMLPKIYNDTSLVKVRYAMRKNFHSVSPRA
jgi:hypothetical protein